MTASTRKASAKQVQVLHAILHQKLDATAQIHTFREKGLAAAGKPAEKQRATYELLNTCHRYEWVERILASEEERSASPNDGSGYEWVITEAGKEALERGFAAVQQQKEEGDMPPATEAPPESKPAWGANATDDPKVPVGPEDPDLQELDEPGQNEDDPADADGEDGGPRNDPADEHEEIVGDDEIELEDPEAKETRYTTEGEQMSFTLTIGGAKPTSSILKVGGKQITFKDREFRKGEVLAFEGELVITEVGARDKKQGTQRFQVAVVNRLEIAASKRK